MLSSVDPNDTVFRHTTLSIRKTIDEVYGPSADAVPLDKRKLPQLSQRFAGYETAGRKGKVVFQRVLEFDVHDDSPTGPNTRCLPVHCKTQTRVRFTPCSGQASSRLKVDYCVIRALINP